MTRDEDKTVAADHITDQAIDAFASRTLGPEALVRFADHLAACDECRRRAALRRDLAADRLALEKELGVVADHVAEDDIHAYVDRRLAPAARRRVAEHLRDCEMCAAEVTDLDRFAASRVRRTIWTRPGYIALEAVAAVVVAFVVWKSWSAPDARPVVALRDQGAAVSLTNDGSLEAGGPLSTADAEIVRNALASGRLSFPPAIADLRGVPGALMGTSASAAFGLRSPVATRVLDDRPTFQWEPFPNASAYVVTVKPEGGGKAVSGPPVTTTSWTPVQPLLRGRTYSWQVVAQLHGEETVSPAPPAPPARFEIVDRETAGRLNALPASHAARGIVYADAGLLDASERELTALATENPDSPLPRKFLAQLRAIRPPSSATAR